MRITNKQKELIARKIAKKVSGNYKSKSVAKHPTFVKYKKAKDKANAMYQKYDALRDVSVDMQNNLAENIFGEDLRYIYIDDDTGRTKIISYHLKDSIIDELHLMELSSHESVDDIINEVSKKFEIK
mgnify:CR=1 FL=1